MKRRKEKREEKKRTNQNVDRVVWTPEETVLEGAGIEQQPGAEAAKARPA